MKYRIITVGEGYNSMQIIDPIRKFDDCETAEEAKEYLDAMIRSASGERD